MIGRVGRLGAALAVAAVATIGAVTAEPGMAASGTCEYTELGRPGPGDNEIRIRASGGVLIGRSGDRIIVSGISCTGGTPTVNNIDRIVVLQDGDRGLRLDLTDGPLGPGATETGPGAEIDILLPLTSEEPTGAALAVTTGRGSNRMTLGHSGEDEVVNLNPKREGRRPDVDIRFEDVDIHDAGAAIYAGAGDDTIDARGGRIGSASFMYLHVHPDTGDDRVFGGHSRMLVHSDNKNGADLFVAGEGPASLASAAGPDTLRGGPAADRLNPGVGRDDVRAGRGDDSIRAEDDKVDEIRCGPGNDTVSADSEDKLFDCENVGRG